MTIRKIRWAAPEVAQDLAGNLGNLGGLTQLLRIIRGAIVAGGKRRGRRTTDQLRFMGDADLWGN